MAQLTGIAVDVEQALNVAVIHHVGHTVGTYQEDIAGENVIGNILKVDECRGASCPNAVGNGI